MGLWINEAEVELFKIDGVAARIYLKRISRGAMLKAQQVEADRQMARVPAEMMKPTREAREIQAEQRAAHDAKPLEERIAAELEAAYGEYDRSVVLSYGLPRIEEDKIEDGKEKVVVTTEATLKEQGVHGWIEGLDPEVCERIFRELIFRNAVLPSRLKA